jgi:hypothetical protein
VPIEITAYDETTDELVPVQVFDADEVGAMLHLNGNTVRDRWRAGRWPHVRIGHARYMTKAMIGEAVESMTQRVGLIPEAPARLGEVLPDEATETIR